MSNEDSDSPSPPSAIRGPTIEQLADIERAQRDLEDTLVPCPKCALCDCCHGVSMVSVGRATDWQRNNAESEAP